MREFMNTSRLPEETRIQQAHLRTASLERALAFYHGVLGFKIIEQDGREASLSPTGQQPAMIVLSEEPGVVPKPARAIGLFHLALRLPSRRDLAQAVRRLSQHRYPIQGAAHHLVSEAVYLADPEENGIELYTDLPAAEWKWESGEVEMATLPLDMESLLSTTEGSAVPSTIAEKTDIGHVHLHVEDLAAAERFYNDFAGFAVTQRSYPGALFFSAGGYHHHIGANVWGGRTIAPPDSAGLISYRIEVPIPEILNCLRQRAQIHGFQTNVEQAGSRSEILQIRDPSGVWMEWVTAAA